MSSYIQNNHIAKHYAAILYESAKQGGSVLLVRTELEKLVELQKKDASFADFCANPTVGRAKKIEIMQAITNGCGDLVVNLSQILAQNNRLTLMSLIAKFFMDLERKDKGEIVVEVTSAHVLSDAQRENIQARVAAAFNAPILLELRQDASLIAGVKIKYGSHELDASAHGRLRLAEERLHRAIQQDTIIIQGRN